MPLLIECVECDGQGVIIDENGEEAPCPNCEGKPRFTIEGNYSWRWI